MSLFPGNMERRKLLHLPYAMALAATALIFLVIGLGIGLAQPYVSQSVSKVTGPSQFTWTYGTVSLGPRTGGYSIYLYFYTVGIGTLSSGISVNGQVYQLFLPTGISFSVSIIWQNTTVSSFSSSGLRSCNAQPYIFTPQGPYAEQNFSCP